MSTDENITSIFKSFRFSSLDETNFNSNIENPPSNEDFVDNNDSIEEEPELNEVVDTNNHSIEEEPELSEVVDTNNHSIKEEPELSEVVDTNNNSDLGTITKPEINDILTAVDNQSKSFLILVFNIEEINNISKNLNIFNSIYDTVYLHHSNSNQYKWLSVLTYLNNNESWKNYKFIWIPDCNINISNDNIVKFLQITESLNQDITQPSVKKSSDSSIYTHDVLLRQTNDESRKACFIENKMPCFKVDFIKNSLISFLNTNDKYITSGWGIDLWWSNHSKQLSVIDMIEVEDTSLSTNKSVGSKEMKYLIKKYKLKLSILIKKN